MSEQDRIGRLALREEGGEWVAYYALDDTMAGALRLGGIAMRFVDRPDRKNQFMDLMRECLGDIIQENIGVRPVWGGAQPAPEHERGKA